MQKHELSIEELNLPKTAVGYPDFSAMRLIEQKIDRVNQPVLSSKTTKSPSIKTR